MARAEPGESMDRDHVGSPMPEVGGDGMGHERRHDPEMALASVLFGGWVQQRESVRLERGIPSSIGLSVIVLATLGLSLAMPFVCVLLVLAGLLIFSLTYI
jgi:hypothetical protein